MTLFTIISYTIIFLATAMIFLKTPINSILCLCAILLLSTIILFLSQVEFLSYIFIMVYVGGIALLFLFVIIMLNLKLDYNKDKKKFRLLSGSTIIFFFVLKIQSLFTLYLSSHLSWVTSIDGFTSTQDILKINHYLNNDVMNFGLFLYTHYFFNFLLVGVILLISMLGVLILSLNSNKISS